MALTANNPKIMSNGSNATAAAVRDTSNRLQQLAATLADTAGLFITSPEGPFDEILSVYCNALRHEVDVIDGIRRGILPDGYAAAK